MTKEKRPDLHQLSFNKEVRDFLDQKLGSTDRKSRIEAINKLLLSENTKQELTIKEQIDLEKLEQLREQRPYKLKKLIAETKIAEGKAKYAFDNGS